MAVFPTTYERRWPGVILTPIAVSNSIITVSSAAGLHSKQKITLRLGSAVLEDLEIKRVLNDTQIQVGTIGSEMGNILNPVAFNGGTLEMQEQERNKIGNEYTFRAVYEEEPAVALRNVLVDRWGRFFSTDNPMPVQLSDGAINIGTVNAEIETQLSHLDNDPDVGDVHDSVRVGDGEDQLQIFPDGSIGVNILESDSNKRALNIYGEVTNVVAGVETTICTFTAGPGKKYRLQRAQFTGENIALYNVYINNVAIATSRTHHGSGLSDSIEFIGGSVEGIEVLTDDVVELRTTHIRPSTANFEGRLQIYELTATTAPVAILTELDDFLTTESDDTLILE
jgi:hypothetical protein